MTFSKEADFHQWLQDTSSDDLALPFTEGKTTVLNARAALLPRTTE